MNRKTQFFKSFTFNQLYTQQEIGERFGKNRHYVSSIFIEQGGIKEDHKKGLTKYYYGDVIMRLTDEGAFDKHYANLLLIHLPHKPLTSLKTLTWCDTLLLFFRRPCPNRWGFLLQNICQYDK